MKESFYFRHDYTAHTDPKVMRMQAKHGLAGYGAFWMIVEMMAAETGRLYMQKDYETIAFALRSNEMLIQSVVEDFGLFEIDDEKFWSTRLIQDYEKRMSRSKQAKDNANARWQKTSDTNKEMQPHSKGNERAMQKKDSAMLREERRGEEKIVKKNIKKEKNIVPPKLEWVERRMEEMEYTGFEAEAFFNHWGSVGWKRSNRQKIINWHLSLATWNGNNKKWSKEKPQKKFHNGIH